MPEKLYVVDLTSGKRGVCWRLLRLRLEPHLAAFAEHPATNCVSHDCESATFCMSHERQNSCRPTCAKRLD